MTWRPTMTKKDYELIAQAISVEYQETNPDTNNDIEAQTIVTVTNRIADYLSMENPRFDRNKFFKACGIED